MSDENVRKHRVEVTFDDGIWARLICPDDGCEPANICVECWQRYDDLERSPCPGCEQPPSRCWIESWFQEYGVELLTGRVVLPLEASVGRIDCPSFRVGQEGENDE